MKTNDLYSTGQTALNLQCSWWLY